MQGGNISEYMTTQICRNNSTSTSEWTKHYSQGYHLNFNGNCQKVQPGQFVIILVLIPTSGFLWVGDGTITG